MESNIFETFNRLIREEPEEVLLNFITDDIDLHVFKEKFNIKLEELIPLYTIWNGQKIETKGIFFDFKNHSSGTVVWCYRLLSVKEIIDNYNFIQSYSNNRISKELIPFAKCTQQIGDKGSTGFAINIKSKEIFKISYYEYDRFVTVYEFSESKNCKDLNEFLTNQFTWRELGINKNATNNK